MNPEKINNTIDTNIDKTPNDLNSKDPEKEKLEESLKIAGEWFYWIMGLSAVNTITAALGWAWYFFFGLGLPLVIGEIGKNIGGAGVVIALIFSLGLSGIFALLGYYTLKRKEWALITGIILYGLDALFLIIIIALLSFKNAGELILGLLGHIYVIYLFIKGFMAMMKLNDLEKNKEKKLYEQVVKES